MTREIKLGLRHNWKQFSLLVIVNSFVGGMVGLERSILPELAEVRFGLEAKTAIFSFIVIFGVSKAITNYFMGAFADRFGRRRLLIAGWLIALPIPFLLIHAESWAWVVFANLLLGINQGLTWSSTVVMKIDLVGQKDRGFAMGLNESAGYLSVGAAAFLTGWIASHYGLIPYPFYLGIVLSVLGLLFSVFLVRDTVHHVAAETAASSGNKLEHVFRDTTWKDPNLGSITQAGLVNNLNDGMVWGLLPILLAGLGFSIAEIGTVAAIYPAVWGLGQLITGKLADILPKKGLLVWGMLLQGICLLLLIFAGSFLDFVLLCTGLGVGTALVYPTFLAGIADFAPPSQRAESIGVFRLWRDLGYAIGALLTGILADLFGTEVSLAVIAMLTVLSALVIKLRMQRRPAESD